MLHYSIIASTSIDSLSLSSKSGPLFAGIGNKKVYKR
jgi:hypothetical protein